MIIQALLIVGVLLFLIFFLANPRNLKIQASKKILGVIFVLIAVFFILFPNSSNRLAHLVGVGRGADLMLYILVLAFIFVTLNSYIRMRQEEVRTTTLARKIAILEANLTQEKIKNKT
jgi:hypothetical protein